MLKESNLIEHETSQQAMDDAIEAWKYAVRNQVNLTTKYVQKIHKLLMRNIHPEIAGKFRQCDVYIGGECRKYISDDLLLARVKDVVVGIINSKNEKGLTVEEKEEAAKKLHVQFEKAHPFEDGNGRTGRILYNIHRLKLGLPLHIISSETRFEEYYPWFQEV